MRAEWVILFFALFGAGASSTSADQDCYGPGDLDEDTVVDLSDYAILERCLAGPAVQTPPPLCGADQFVRGDLDGDGDVDLGDFGGFCLAFERQYFDYGPQRANLEAEMLAMDVSYKLRAPDAEYSRILTDLELIRLEYPELTTVIDDPDYMPNELMVALVEGQPLDEYAALNEYYQVVDEEWLFLNWWVLTFCDNVNAPVLASIYSALPAVQYADPDWYVGQDDYITVTPSGATYRYNIDDGFWDCFDGCDCHREWVIEVDESGTVTVISYEEWGMPWCPWPS